MAALGKYELHEQLGRGGFGTVYRAVDTTLQREVALKVLHPQLTTDPDFLERFRREARLVASLKSPHIVTIYDLDEKDGRVFIAMEYLPGGSLKQRLEVEGSLTFEEAARIMKETCAGLSAAHNKGLVHRDIKPGNILFDEEGKAVIGDFGLARAVQVSGSSASSGSGVGAGTPAYRAPELWRGKPPASPATDIYSLGCMLSEMLTGKVLFDGSTPDEFLTQHILEGPILPDRFPMGTPEGVQAVLERALAKDPTERYQTAEEFSQSLQGLRTTAGERSNLKQAEPVDDLGNIPSIDSESETEVIPLAPLPEHPTGSPFDFFRKYQKILLIGIAGLLLIGLAIWILPGLMTPPEISALNKNQAEETTLTNTQTPIESPPVLAVENSPAPEPTVEEPSPGPELKDALTGKYKGSVVTVEGPFTDEDAIKFDNSMKEFEEKTGIDIQYYGSVDYTNRILVKAAAGQLPDIGDFKEPGLLASLAANNQVVDLTGVIDQDWMKKNYNQSWLDTAMAESSKGPIMAGVWSRVDDKSLVWYPKAAFDKAGYVVPTTWNELTALTDQIKADGSTPWCIGIESGAATGWPMTDWIEDVMLRTTSLENYDKWVKGELKFDSPEVRRAVDIVGDLWFTNGNAYGGRSAIVTTNFADAPAPMFDNPPKCWLHKQADWITYFFPEEKKFGIDYDFFFLPGIDNAYGKPSLVSGDQYALFNDRPETRAVIQYLSTGSSVKGWIEAGGTISPHRDSNLEWYHNEVERKIAETLLETTAVRFDGSDLMPPSVGMGSFWSAMTRYASQTIDLDTALGQIDQSWPK